MQFCGKKIIFARVDQERSLQRNSVIAANTVAGEPVALHYAHTLTKQAHLCPSLHTDVLPGFDDLLETSDAELVCIGENSEFFNYEVDGRRVTNPGHFSRFSSFLSVNPDSLQVELCSVDH